MMNCCNQYPGHHGCWEPLPPSALQTQPGQYFTADSSGTYAVGSAFEFTLTMLESSSFVHSNATDFIARHEGTFLVSYYVDVSSAATGSAVALAINGVTLIPTQTTVTTAGGYSNTCLVIVQPGDVLTLRNIGPSTIVTSPTINASARLTILKAL